MAESIILSKSEYDRLVEEIHQIQARIIELTALRDDLLYHICPALKAEYEEKIASLERELLAAQMYLQEKRRIIEILQAQMNRQKAPSMEEAREEAHEEFRSYQEDLKRKAKEAEDFRSRWEKESQWSAHDRKDREKNRKSGEDQRAEKTDGSQETAGSHGTDGSQETSGEQKKDSKKDKEEDWKDQSTSETGGKDQKSSEAGGQDTESEEKEQSPVQKLKALYRKIVKRLHPDVHPNPTEREKELLNQASEAYQHGDLEALQRIWDELSGADAPEEQFADTPEGIEKLKELLIRLKARMTALEKEIRQIRSDYPYTLRSFLQDEQAVEQKRQRLKKQLEKTREMDRQLAEYIEQLQKQMGFY